YLNGKFKIDIIEYEGISFFLPKYKILIIAKKQLIVIP
ncbi:MAG: hypothetical protein ACI9S8_003272, partial [Chlamydiales bacterium]